MKTVLPYLPALALCALLAWATSPDAVAVVRAPVTTATVVRPVTTVPFALASGSTTSSATAPALKTTIGVAEVVTIAADPGRFAFFLTDSGTEDLACCLGSACSETMYDVLLLPGERLELQGFSTWGGPVSCVLFGVPAGGPPPGGGGFSAASYRDPASPPPPPSLPPPPPACLPDFSVCTSNAQCCTGTCAFDPGTGNNICGLIG